MNSSPPTIQDLTATVAHMALSKLSLRGTSASKAAATENLIWSVIANLWHPELNPDGYISLGVAENDLMHDELSAFINAKPLADSRALTYGDGPSGSVPLRSAIASFLNEKLSPVKTLERDDLVVTNGVTSAIEQVAWALCDEGDGVLLGRPYYRAFIGDIQTRTGAKVVPVAFGDIDPCGIECVVKYEEALLESEKKGVNIRVLMLCHPHNPLGRCYGKETLVALMKLCEKYKVHLISDEIYALSIFKNTTERLETEPPPFQSILSIDPTGIIDPSLVHVLWGTSKDFGANGIRIGVIISNNNPDFLSACGSLGIYSSPSSLSENAVLQIVSNADFVNSYITTNQERLAAAYTFAAVLLSKHGIEYAPGVNAAFFLWANLGKKYREKYPAKKSDDDFGLTKEIWDRCMENRVYIVHGDDAGTEKPGWFRVVFTQDRGLVETGVGRIIEAIS
ncbi:aminotransferase [Amniculicola lignicola CBS 123094]|uniref:Aminotransferase n=1 Tax=Amniculicola lignicola CBS 123094 TaxID=1392246 RepID=A0A6A5WZN1_9PLEO|nr:aminotransferase [Amniculicola lignicola CBS 123094]